MQKTSHSTWTRSLSQRSHVIESSIIDGTIGLLQRKGRDTISFAMGCPGPDAIPVEALRRIAAQVLRDPTVDVLNYGPTEGERNLREALLQLGEGGHHEIEPASLLITAGGMQGLDLVCKLFVDPGDLVVIESPTYTNGIGTIRSYQGALLEAPIDEEGLVVDAIPDLVRHAGVKPKLFYVIPNSQNPMGVTLSLRRRQRLLELARDYEAIILEDDPYGLLAFSRQAPPSLYALDTDRTRVVAVRSFSKIIAPGLRVGWVLAPPPIVSRMIAAKQAMDTCTNVPGQRIVAQFLREGLLQGHLMQLRHTYAAKKATMRAALARSFHDLPGTTWTDPDGGFFLWLTCPTYVDAVTLFSIALEEGVAFIPGSAFSPSGRFGNAMRLCFTYPDGPDIERGVRRLRRAFDRLPEPTRDDRLRASR